jgi:heterodisulfide reductase subunit C
MRTRISVAAIKGDFVREVGMISGENPFACNQCGKCSAGCPVAADMDLLPNQVIRLVQLGLEEVLQSQTIWSCAACLACSTRCPKGLDLPRIMEALRVIQLQRAGNKMDNGTLPPERLNELPQIALVGGFRKYSA